MNTRYYFPPDSLYSTGIPVSFSSSTLPGENHTSVGVRNGSARLTPSTFMIRTAMRISRARWFSFLRRVFHYQNGSRSDLGSNPFNSGSWIALEFIVLVVQISIISITLSNTKQEKPVWPLRIWIVGYDIGCLLSMPLLYWRYRHRYVAQGSSFRLSDAEQRSNEESRSSHLMNKSRTFLELFFAIWFVMGNVWVFDSRFGSFNRAPKLHVLCISLLAWNAVTYSFPFLLFLLLCCCVPLTSNFLGYNMNMGSFDRGASDDQISRLPSWKYKEVDVNLELGDDAQLNSDPEDENSECCICLAKYRDKEEVRQLPCSHLFHQRCVDQWLRIISCCPLCKQELER
ncbi:zinc finger protein [Macleaya cordata]|uniref:Zinc finger protein n=1 Tax=Macleaya cordata TaxID=56857 RepID=A0A200RAK3_MACCD|nr:zinc finger protein [Macleaya cordata]